MPIANQVYKRDYGRCAINQICFPGEEYTFYMNAPVSDNFFPGFFLQVVSDATGVRTNLNQGPNNLNTPQRIFRDAVNYNIYAVYVLPPLPFGMYHLAIWDGTLTPGAEKARSSSFLVEDPDMVDNTALLSYRNTVNKFGFDYEGLPNWYNKVRYPLIQTGFGIEKDVKQYRAVSDRSLRNLPTYRDEIYKIESYRFTEDGHKAIAAIYDHDTIFLNNSYITPKSTYTVQDRRDSVTSNGEIDVLVNMSIVPPANIINQVRIFSDVFSTVFL